MSTAQTLTIVISLAVVALALVGLGYWNWKMIIEAEKNTIASADKGHGSLNKHLDEIKADLRELRKEVGQVGHRLSKIEGWIAGRFGDDTDKESG